MYSVAPGKGTGRGCRGLYVFLKASVQELRDDAVKKPSASDSQ